MDPRPIPLPRPEQDKQESPTRSSPPTSAGRKANGAASGLANGGLTLSITPPRFAPLAALDTSNADHSQQQQQQQQQQNPQNNGNVFNGPQLQYTPLTFHNLSNGSLASPSSPSYSTLAVARARAAAAAEAAQAQGLQTNAPTHGHEQAIAGDQGAPGGGIRSVHEGGATGPFTSSSYSSAASSPGSATTPAIFSSSSSLPVVDHAQDTTITTSNTNSNTNSSRHQMLPASLSSSSSSLLSSSTQSPPNSTSSTGLNHLQENANAEREVSEILPKFLYLGGELIEEDQLVGLESLGVRRVLNMAENCDDELVIERWGRQGYLKVGLRDHVNQDLKEGLATAIQFI
ncbi:hypothetical protein CPB97_005738, partial [Podila verticillata]